MTEKKQYNLRKSPNQSKHLFQGTKCAKPEYFEDGSKEKKVTERRVTVADNQVLDHHSLEKCISRSASGPAMNKSAACDWDLEHALRHQIRPGPCSHPDNVDKECKGCNKGHSHLQNVKLDPLKRIRDVFQPIGDWM